MLVDCEVIGLGEFVFIDGGCCGGVVVYGCCDVVVVGGVCEYI